MQPARAPHLPSRGFEYASWNPVLNQISCNMYHLKIGTYSIIMSTTTESDKFVKYYSYAPFQPS